MDIRHQPMDTIHRHMGIRRQDMDTRQDMLIHHRAMNHRVRQMEGRVDEVEAQV